MIGTASSVHIFYYACIQLVAYIPIGLNTKCCQNSGAETLRFFFIINFINRKCNAAFKPFSKSAERSTFFSSRQIISTLATCTHAIITTFHFHWPPLTYHGTLLIKQQVNSRWVLYLPCDVQQPSILRDFWRRFWSINRAMSLQIDNKWRHGKYLMK